MAVKYRDYYEVLGVPRTAAADKIKTAYRRLARKYHPDLHTGKARKKAEEQFKELNEANAVLSNPEKRVRYDQLGSNWKTGMDFTPPPDGPGMRGEHGNFDDRRGTGDFTDFFASLFGGNRGGGRATRSVRGSDIEAELGLELEEAQRGGRRSVVLQGQEACPGCGGTGAQDEHACLRCGGQGVISRPHPLDVHIPAGVRDGTRIRLAGQGQPGVNGGPSGDLYLVGRLAPHRLFRVTGDDLDIELPAYPWEAALGAEVEVPTLDGRVTLKVPPGTQAGQRLRLRGKGLARRKNGAGDLYATVRLVLPRQLTDEQRRLLEEMRGLTRESPRDWRR